MTASPSQSGLRTPETRLWHAQAHMPSVKTDEILIVRGDGAYVWDATGRRLFDATASLWYCNVGHGRQAIVEAVAAQMERLETYHSFGPFAPLAARELASRLASMIPSADRIFLTSGGGDSIETAAKLARRYWSANQSETKQVIITRRGAYHGLHAFGTSIAGIPANRAGFGSLIPDCALVETHDPDNLRSVIEEIGPHRVAAFFCEPVIGTGGVIPPEDGYLGEVQAICRDYDVLFVLDEVITGFGRLGKMFAAQRYGLEPDLVVLAKGITSGYLPLGALAVNARVAAPFWDDGADEVFRHGLTYSGHASACAAAMANLDILESESLVDSVDELEPRVEQALGPLAQHELVADVRSVGLMAGVQLHSEAVAQRLAAIAPDHGLILRALPGGTVQVSPPFIINAEEVEWLGATLGDLLETV